MLNIVFSKTVLLLFLLCAPSGCHFGFSLQLSVSAGGHCLIDSMATDLLQKDAAFLFLFDHFGHFSQIRREHSFFCSLLSDCCGFAVKPMVLNQWKGHFQLPLTIAVPLDNQLANLSARHKSIRGTVAEAVITNRTKKVSK